MSTAHLADLLAELMNAADDAPDDGVHRLKDMIIRSVHLVDRGANKRTFAVRKRGETMANDETLGSEVVEGADGSLTALSDTAKADTVPAPVKAALLRYLTEASERTLSLLNRIKGAKEGDGAIPGDFLAEAKAVAGILGGIAEKYPSPKSKAATEDDEVEKAKGKKPPEVEEEMEKAKAKPKFDPAQFEDEEAKKAARKQVCPECGKEPCVCEEMKKAKAKPTEEENAACKPKKAADEEEEKKAPKKPDEEEGVAKAGRRMAADRLSRLKDAVAKLQDVLKELDPDGQSELAQALGIKKADTKPATVPAGKASTESAADVQKRGRDGVNWGINLNNPQLHRDTADKDTSFFE